MAAARDHAGLSPATRADLRDLVVAIRALDRIAERHGEHSDGDWHDYEFDPLSSSRSSLCEWLSDHEAQGAH